PPFPYTTLFRSLHGPAPWPGCGRALDAAGWTRWSWGSSRECRARFARRSRWWTSGCWVDSGRTAGQAVHRRGGVRRRPEILCGVASQKSRLLQSNRDMFLSMIPLVLIILLIAGGASQCDFSPGGPKTGEVPEYDVDAALQMRADT